ncbi:MULTISPECIES: hypothetical protein [Rhodococcus]|uniref:hypothetical protein n=1 Tax=Rhodococcus TaxID=1827 RepID=UPI0013593A59|nr:MULTISPECIES: hypothetical protein [Rhodococcus]KAF0964936.1 hypothetical protein MLGJGCBP_01930 [Rhodococcus sp. T7]UOT08317.1 hypothetical protein MPY17_39095 [Rhodococcus opacus]
MLHAFVDENKTRGITVVAAIADPRAVDTARKALTALRLRGQERIHFKSERDSRRRQICSTITALDVHVRVYDATTLDAKTGRTRCLEQLVTDLAAEGASRLVLEQDDSLVKADRATLYTATRRHGVEEKLRYQHLPARSEPMLWIPDAVAWCLARGGQWPARVAPIITTHQAIR